MSLSTTANHTTTRSATDRRTTDSVIRKARVFERRETEILNATLSCTNQRWDPVTVTQIASRVGIAKRNCYLHFASEQEIYARLALYFHRSLLEHVSQPLVTADHTPGHTNNINQHCAAQFRRLLPRDPTFHQQNSAYRRAIKQCNQRDSGCLTASSLAQRFIAIDDRRYHSFSELNHRGAGDGNFRSLPSRPLLTGLLCALSGAIDEP